MVSAKVEPIVVPAWARMPWLIHGFSTRAGGRTTAYRADGDLNLGFTAEDSRATVVENRELLLRSLGSAPGSAPVTLRQTHSAILRRVDQSHMHAPAALEGDGLMTDAPGVLLGILTADCVPVLVVDPRNRAVAAFHAGWRGTVQQIVERGVVRMRDEFASDPRELLAAVGPAIGACCYEVGEELRDRFADRFAYAAELFSSKPTLHLDLAEANRRQLISAGLAPDSITMTGLCTNCRRDRFFSHRAERGVTGRMMTIAGIRSNLI